MGLAQARPNYLLRNMHVIKVYALNKQVSKYVVIHGNSFFSSKIRIVSLVLTHYGFASLCMCFVHLMLDHSTPDYISRVLVIKTWCA